MTLLVKRSNFRSQGVTALLICFLLVASGCGFKLRGLYDIPSSLTRVAIVTENPNSEMVRTLQQALQANGVTVDSQAPFRIEILEESMTRRTLSLDSSARPSEYEIRGEVTFQVTDLDDQLILTPRSLMSERSYNVDSSNITASESQEPILRQQIRQDLSQQIMRQYIRIQAP
ncbi:MAG: LPS assembly lipoprotein LptE [Nitrincola sp.]|nr:LPS assembly lipoprotein LptE [Nitrincola sp.]